MAPGTADGRRVAVALTFDFDAEAAWLGSFKLDTPSALSRGTHARRRLPLRVSKLVQTTAMVARSGPSLRIVSVACRYGKDGTIAVICRNSRQS